jgi:hypothetical protein
MRFLLFTACVFFTFSLNANALTCDRWNKIEDLSTDKFSVKVHKQMFVMGAMGAIKSFGTEGIRLLHKGDIGTNVLVEGLNKICSDYKNTNLDVLVLFYPVIMGVRGVPESKIENYFNNIT